MLTMFRKLFRDQSGATAIEYGLLAALVSVAIIGTVTALGGQLNNTFGVVDTALEGAAAPGAGGDDGAGAGAGDGS